jgi:hypothetical protein
MRSICLWWNSYWFAPAPPENLSVCRVLFFGVMFLYFLPRDFSAWANVSNVFWEPTWLFSGQIRLPMLSAAHPVLSERSLMVMQTVWKVAIGLSCIGLMTRISTLLSFVLGVYLIGLPANFGHASHQYPVLIFIMAIMASSRCGDAWSVDRLVTLTRRGSDRSARHSVTSGEYTWPLRMVWLVMALVLFAAGVSKVRHSGIAWITSDTLAINLIVNNYYGNTIDDPLTSWGLYVAQYRRLCRMLAACTVILELSFPLALISQTVRFISVPSAVVMLIGIRVLLGPAFELFAWCFVFWVSWERVGRWIGAAIGRDKRARDVDGHIADRRGASWPAFLHERSTRAPVVLLCRASVFLRRCMRITTEIFGSKPAGFFGSVRAGICARLSSCWEGADEAQAFGYSENAPADETGGAQIS